MSFAVSWAFWFALGIPVIVLLYLLRLKRKEASVSSLLFWLVLLEETPSRALWRRLRHWMSLLLHLLIFTLILLALARPAWRRKENQPAGTVVILDDRARSQAGSKDRTSFSQGIQKLRAMVPDVSPSHPLAVVGMAGGPRILLPFSSDPAAISAAINSFQSTDAPGDEQKAKRLAQELLQTRSTAAAPVLISEPSRSRDNVAVTRFAARPLPASPDTAELFAEVQNFGPAAVDTNLEITLDDRPLDVVPLHLGPGEKKTKLFSALPSPGSYTRGLLRARLDRTDALPFDNSAFAVFPRQSPFRVLLVTEGNLFLERALESNAQIRFEILTPGNFSPQVATGFDVIVFDRALPANFDFGKANGNLLFIGRTPFDLPEGNSKLPPVTDEDVGDPLLARISLKSVNLLDVKRVDLSALPPSWNSAYPLRSGDVPIIVRLDGPGRRAVLFPFDLLSSDLPLRVAFPLLIQNTIQWLANRPVMASAQAQAGEIIDLRPGEQITTEAVGSSGTTTDKSTEATSKFQPMHCGFYRISGTNGERWIAVNTFSTEESSLILEPPDRDVSPVEVHPGRIFSDTFAPWMLFALAGLLLFALEWWLFHTRRTE